MEFTLEEMRGHLAALEARISEACKIAGRSRESVKLVWVSKFHPAEAVENAISLGATDFGENRVQEAELKFSAPRMAKDGSRVRCHVIGPVQSNKLKKHPFHREHRGGRKTGTRLRGTPRHRCRRASGQNPRHSFPGERRRRRDEERFGRARSRGFPERARRKSGRRFRRQERKLPAPAFPRAHDHRQEYRCRRRQPRMLRVPARTSRQVLSTWRRVCPL